MTPEHLEALLCDVVDMATRVRFKHPGNQARGIEFRYCILCGGEWLKGKSQIHRNVILGHEVRTCPVGVAAQHFKREI